MQTVEGLECFHLLFLAQLGLKLDKRSYALKGGCNLRFFFGSIRYSEDMDLDVHGVSVAELRRRVDGILGSISFLRTLSARGLAIEHITSAKQTETTQRWKFGVLTPASAAPAPTRIEFSRRRSCAEAVLGHADPALMGALGLTPVLACHYPAAAAWRQKIEALAGRAAAQARDVFDLHHLLSSGAVNPARDNIPLGAGILAEARERCLAMSFKDFKSQVLAFLVPEHQAAYDDPGVWDQMALRVTEALDGGGHEIH